ncbi:MAG: Na+/H+ antiporter NhaA [Anaerolineales bacterium]
MAKVWPLFQLRKLIRIGPAFSSFQEFIREQGAGGVLLLATTLIALAWANSAWAESYFELWSIPIAVGIGNWQLTKPLLMWINDGLMAVFFFVVGLEIKREILVGELSKPRQALFPAVAALGGMFLPAAFYLTLNFRGPGSSGWAIPMATDIAFALGVLSLLGRRAPLGLKVFLTAVAIVDDIGAVLVIAIFYSHDIFWISLALAALILLALFALNRASVRNLVPYSALGLLLWLAFLQSGVHATVAGVLLAATIPTSQRIDAVKFVRRSRAYLDDFESSGGTGKEILTNEQQQYALQALEDAAESVGSPLKRLEHTLHPWVAYAIVPIFALANAGVTFSGTISGAFSNPIGLGIVLGLVLGKQLGITSFTWIFHRLGLVSKPRGLSWQHIYGAAWLGGIGFTLSLFVTSLAFTDAASVAAAKIGILTASAISAVGAAVVLMRKREE